MLLTDILLGAMSVGGAAAGAAALVLYRKNGNGHAPEPAPAAVAPTAPVVVEGLAELPDKIEQGLAPVFEGAIGRMANLVQLQIEALKPPATEELTAQEWDARFERIAEGLNHPLIPITPPVATLEPELVTKLEHIADRLDTIIASIPEPEERRELGAKLVRSLAELPARISEMLMASQRTLPPPGNARTASGGPHGPGGEAGGRGAMPPPRRMPPAPRALPPGSPHKTPQIPAPYVAGSVFIPAATVSDLLDLIQQQLAPNCPGSAVEFQLAADDANADAILVGAASVLGGPLSVDNYAYKLEATSPPRVYRSTFPGSSAPLGDLQVLAAGAAMLHVEVQA